MPSEMESNQQALSNAQMQLQAVQESLNRDRERQTINQRQIANAEQVFSQAAPTPSVEGQPGSLSAAAQLEVARATLKQLRMRLTDDHPDIKKLNRTIKDLEQQASAEALRQPVSPDTRPSSPAEAARASQLSDLRIEEVLLKERIAKKQEDEKRLLATMSAYRQRLEAAPAVAGQITGLMRDYTTLQSAYQNLLAKSQEAKVSANVERRQIGEQFKIIDPPRIALRPASPNRVLFNILGILAGLGLGVGLAALVEYRDTSLRTEDDVLIALALPVVAFVPTMTTVAERAHYKRRRLLMASSAATALLVTMAALAWKMKLFNF
jgi:uncharacterized protein involved in exopolysaccharide biosynthesis